MSGISKVGHHSTANRQVHLSSSCKDLWPKITCLTTGGKFACACVYPLNDDNAIAGVKMAREIGMFLLVCVCFLIQANFAAYKYVVCGKNVKGKSDARCDAYITLNFNHVLESVIHPVQKYVGGAGMS